MNDSLQIKKGKRRDNALVFGVCTNTLAVFHADSASGHPPNGRRVSTARPKQHAQEGTEDSVKFHLEEPQDFKAAIALEI